MKPGTFLIRVGGYPDEGRRDRCDARYLAQETTKALKTGLGEMPSPVFRSTNQKTNFRANWIKRSGEATPPCTV